MKVRVLTPALALSIQLKKLNTPTKCVKSMLRLFQKLLKTVALL